MTKNNDMKLLQGDCLGLIKGMPEGSIDLTVTSPPHDNLRTYNGNNSQWTQNVWEEVLSELYRVTTDGGVVVWVAADATINGSETGTSFKQALHAMTCGFSLHDTMIWRKPNFSNPSSNRYHQTFEYMFVFSKGKIRNFNGIKDRSNVCAGGVGSYGENTSTQMDGSKKTRPRTKVSAFGLRHNVWDMKTTGQDGTSKKYAHPAMFPENLVTDHILSWSNKNDLVFDPFMGSGTTGVACVNTDRRFLGIELDETYFCIAQSRIKEATQK